MHPVFASRAARPHIGIRTALMAGTMAAVWTAAPATAQPGGEVAASAAEPMEIIVSARRRDERIQDVPLAVTALQGEMLQGSGVVAVADLPLAAPSLTMTPSPGGGRSSPNFAIRGLSQQELSILGDQSVSVYVGEAVIARVQGINGALFDIGSVEVLRGPQGTLFGRNTTGGAVVIRPNKPTDRLEAMFAVSLGNFDTRNTETMLNIPLADGVNFRVAGRTLRDDGYVYDELLGRNVDFTRQQAVRASLAIEPSPDFEMLATYEYFHEDSGGVGAYLGAINPDAANNTPEFRAARGYRPLEDLLAEQQARGIYRIASGTPAFIKINTHLASHVMSYHVSDNITLKNIFAYRKVRDNLRDDLDGTESAIFPQQRIDRSWQFSEEFQIMGETERLDWIAGLYYFKERGRLWAYSAGNAVDPGDIEHRNVLAYPDAGLSLTDVAARNISYAVFAQGTYEVTDGLKLTAGVRFNRDKRRGIIRNRLVRGDCRFTTDGDNDPSTPETLPPVEGCMVVADKSFSEPTYNLSLDYRIDADKLVYVAHRHGYRSGGFGSRATSEEGLQRYYNPETVDDFEIGVKANWRPGGMFLTTNIAAYTADYKDIQRILTDSSFTPVQAVTVNAASARIRGVEADILFRPVTWLDLTANYAYTDAKFKNFITPTGVDLSDAPLARAPKHVYTLGARVNLPTPAEIGELSFGGSYYHHGSYNADDGYVAGITDMPGYNLVNVDASWRGIMGTGFDLSGTITNLAKEKYNYYVANLTGLGVLPYFAGEPRRFTVTLRYNFGG